MKQAGLAALMLPAAGCLQPATKPEPLPVPKTPELVEQAERSSELRSTIVPGQAPVPTAPKVTPDPVRPGPIALNLPATDIATVAKSVLGDVLHLPYSIAPGVNGQVTLVTPGPVARESVLPLFEAALRGAGLALSKVGSGYLIQPVAAAQANGPVAPETVGFGTEIVSLQFINGNELKKLVDSVLPGVITSVDQGSNAVTIAGTTGQ
ncbi:MAG TPA: hypothetical protein VE567_07395, partial [Sphingomonas sp.]|nr:hypothetical protein [Sphingomonas sp.]